MSLEPHSLHTKTLFQSDIMQHICDKFDWHHDNSAADESIKFQINPTIWTHDHTASIRHGIWL